MNISNLNVNLLNTKKQKYCVCHYLDSKCYLATFMETTMYLNILDALCKQSVLFMCLV